MEIKDLKVGDEVYVNYKKIIQEIPNFDPEIFFDITGIDVKEDIK